MASLSTSHRRPAGFFLLALTALTTIVGAQTCYFPDGVTVSSDVVCNTTAAAGSACCAADSFCMDNGLCFGGGVVTRGSCSDQSWASESCATYCTSNEKSSEIILSPCGTTTDGATTFACGSNSTSCTTSDPFTLSGGSSFVLRPSQIASLLGTATGTNATAGLYTAGDMAGLGIGLAVPLFLGLLVALLFLHRERQKHARPKLMYRLPDDMQYEHETAFTRPPALGGSNTSQYGTSRPGTAGGYSMAPSVNTVASQPPPPHLQTMLSRYESMKKDGGSSTVVETELASRHELDAAQAYTNASPVFRHELDSKRMSRGS